MSGDTVITVVGNAVREPELRWTNSGAAVAKFTVASTPRTFDKQTNEWKDGQTLYLPVTVWRRQAENVAESVVQGTRVIVQGRLSQRSYEDREGVKRTVYELEADDVAVSLRSATAQVKKNEGKSDAYRAASAASSRESRANDPWTQVPGGGQGGQPAQGGWGAGEGEAPF